MKYRAQQPLQIDPRQDLTLYINDLHPYDLDDLKQTDSDSESDPEPGSDNPEQTPETTEASENKNPFIVRAACLTESGQSVSVDITEFRPYFYIEIPDNWRTNQLNCLINRVKELVYYQNRSGLLNAKIVLGKPFSHFTGHDKFQYAKLTFRNSQSYKSYSYVFKNPIKVNGLFRSGHKFKLFESNITPLLRLLHQKDIKPSGWIKLPGNQYLIEETSILPDIRRQCRRINAPQLNNSHCQLHLEINWQHLISLPDKLDIPKLIYAAYDIEADSSHGDFPLTRKTYQKLARELIRATDKAIQAQITVPRGERDLRSQIRRWLELAFDPYYCNNGIRHLALAEPVEHLTTFRENTIKPLIQSIIYPLVKDYHTMCLNATSDTDDITQLAQEDQINEIHLVMESNLPQLNLEQPGIDYRSLAMQLAREYHNALTRNLKIVQTTPIECLITWLTLAFDPDYDGEEINHVYTQNDAKTFSEAKPDQTTFDGLTPKIVEYCIEARSEKSKHAEEETTENTANEIKLPMTAEEKLDSLLTKHLPPVQGDRVIQIGTTFKRYGESDCFLKHIITLDTCSAIHNPDLIADEHKSIKLPAKIILQEIRKWASSGLESYNASAQTRNRKTIPPNLINTIVNYISLDGLDQAKLNQTILDLRYQKQFATDQAEVIIESYQTEKEVLLAWTRLIQQADPDIILGYNVFGFDFKFMYQRAEVLGCLDLFSQLGRFKDFRQELKEQKLSSSGLGDNLLYYIPMYGRVLIDLIKVVQVNYKLSSYKLDSVCKEFMYMSKNDLPPKELFILQKGSADDRAKIARYCLIDCVLCNRLVDKLEIITNNIGMSNVCTVPLSYLFLRGQGVKILSLVAKECELEGYLLPVLKKAKQSDNKSTKPQNDPEDPEDEGGFEGAIVLPAKKGVKFTPTVVNDFNSLYPSCMISENLSHDSYVIPNSKWDNLPDFDYVTIEYDLYEEIPLPGRKKTQKVKVGVKTCKFAQLPDNQKSLLPRILQKLLKARKETRKEQKKYPTGSFKWNVLEGLQLAYKITANSLYGQTGAVTSDIYLKDIAACTTATGRKLMYFTRDFFEANYPGCTTVYGDSVTGPTPILCQRSPTGLSKGQISLSSDKPVGLRPTKLSDESSSRGTGSDGYLEYLTAETLGNGQWTRYHGDKEACPPKPGYRVWSDQGFTEIKRVIRHRTSKSIIQVRTRSGLVEVTEDHSLLTAQGQKIKPSELRSKYNEQTDANVYLDQEFDTDNDTIELLHSDLPAGANQLILPRFSPYINEHVAYWMGHLAHEDPTNQSIKSCNLILNATKQIKWRFFEGLFSHERSMMFTYDFNVRELTSMACLYHLYDSLGYLSQVYGNQVALMNYDEQGDQTFPYEIVFDILLSKPNLHAPFIKLPYLDRYSNMVTSVIDLGQTSDYVYDLETSNHHFSAGVGRLIVHNTDSCFNAFECKDMYGQPLTGLDAIYRSIEYSVEGALAISRQLKPPHNLEFEKVINPFILLTKKRYTGLYYTTPFSPETFIKSMGIVLKRRDNAPIVKKVFGRILDIIIYEQNLDKALTEGRKLIEKVLKAEYPLEDFVISKNLSGWYKNPNQIAHAVLARRIAQRDPGNRPQPNDRIPYCFVTIPKNLDKNAKVLQGDRIEPPDFVREHGLKLDYRYYIERQIMKPVVQIFDLTEYDGQKFIFDEPLEDYDCRIRGIHKISEFFKPKSITDGSRLAQYKKLSQFAPSKKINQIESDESTETDTESDTETDDE